MDKKVQNKNQVEKHFVKIVYKDIKDNVQQVTKPIEELDYDEKESYRENVEMAASRIFDDGGFWVSPTMIIPYHRIVAICCDIPSDSIQNKNQFQNKGVNKRPGRRFRRKNKLQQNDKPQEKNDKFKEIVRKENDVSSDSSC